MNCGRIRKALGPGWTPLVSGELQTLSVAALCLEPGETYAFDTGEHEYALVLVHGHCQVSMASGLAADFGPRRDPFQDLPFGLMVSRDEHVTVSARQTTLIGVGCAPAASALPSTLITPQTATAAVRGVDNWQRTVRLVCWSDNTQGNQLIAGETLTPSGNWSTIPPHRHQYDLPGSEIPYEEAYFFQFSKPQGYGLIWQFDAAGEMDQAFSLRNNDLAYMGGGYHPTACGPGADLYHLTFIAGPYRKSMSSVHPDFRFLLDDHDLHNPYARQVTR
jgi:5-deoxy-glucuronate isomerase